MGEPQQKRPQDSDFPNWQGELLRDMRALRDQVIRLSPNGPYWDEAQRLKGAIDGMAGKITGDYEYYWAKAHSIP